MNYIYTLSDPNTNQVRYIGKTNNLERRYKRHTCKFTLVNENTFKSKWILSLLDDEKLPILEVIDECVDKIIDNLESYWISQFKCWGFDLTNMTDGGDGFKGNSKYQIRSEYSKFLIKMSALALPVFLFLLKARVVFTACLTSDAAVTIGTSVTTIAANAYNGCSTITSLVVSSTVTSIGKI
jgi:uncharacterized membrane protein